MIELFQVSKTYASQTKALQHVSFKVSSGQVVYLLGASGSGKSTLVKIIAGLEDADQGKVLVNGEEITGPSANLVPGYDTIAFVSQDYKLQHYWTVSDNIGKKISHLPDHEREQRIQELLQLCQLETYADRMPMELSGGQQQRVAIAAAVSDLPEVVLLDEPFSNLDHPLKAEVRKEVIDMLRQLDITVILVSHDPAEALAVADSIILLKEGQIEQMATPEELYRKPNSYYAAKFLGTINELTINKKKALIRPEKLVIDPQGEWQGQVITSSFAGAYYVCELTVENQPRTLLIHSKIKLNPNSTVRFSIENH